jgi:2-phospho-L-lactate transferase/gluconeogenesis factor (CofD/UPF0052 family)
MSIGTIASIVMWLSGGVIAGVIFIVGFAIKVLIFMTKANERLTAQEELMRHTIKSGENIKDQLAAHHNLITEISLNFKYISKAIDDIKETLKQSK